ncbi:hypothetical protein HRbin30_01156 [bacterium HR30]|nr:hypothetical protein HRbin30_01156 [bacterium HR30]
MAHLTESGVESAALGWLEAIASRIAHGAGIAPDQRLTERRDCADLVREPACQARPSRAPEAEAGETRSVARLVPRVRLVDARSRRWATPPRVLPRAGGLFPSG